MTSPIVSVIVPIYNAEKFLRPCLNCIVNQTLKDIEIFLIDDGSSDSSLDILQEYADNDKRIKILKQNHLGPGPARDNAIAIAKGEFISFMDSDDIFEPDLLESLHKKIESTGSDIAFCRFWMYNQEKLLDEPAEFDVDIELLPEDTVFSADSYTDYILSLYITAVWSSMYRREFVLKNKLKFSLAPRAEDNLFSQPAIAMAAKISFLNRKLIHYRRFYYTSLTDKVNIYWLNSFIVHREVRDYLVERNKFEQLKPPFFYHMLKHIMYHVIEKCLEPVKSIVISYTKKYLKEVYDLDLYDIAKYIDEYTYLLYQTIYRKYNDTSVLEKYLQNDKQKIIPVVYSANNAYVKILAVSLQSLIEHANKSNFYDIYILHSDISMENECNLERISGKNIRVTCINVEKRHAIDGKLYSQSHYSKEMFYRFLIPQIIYGYDKILYIDVDTLILQDVAELYNNDVSEFPIGACVQPLQKNFQKYCLKKLDCNPENYVNSGILLFNTKKWNELNLTEKCFTMVGKKGRWRAPDQDILNILCKNNIKILDNRWNTIATISLRPKKKYLIDAYENEFAKLGKAYILHYTSCLKPWIYRNSAEAALWWKYARRSLYYKSLYYFFLIKR